MSLAEGLNRVMASRGLATRDVLARLGMQRDRATIYRVLAGQTVNPRLDTLLSLCTALDTTPDELLDQADVFDKRPRSVDALDLRLRIAFRQMQSLPAELKPAAIAQVLFLAESWKRAADGRPVDDLLDALAEQERESRPAMDQLDGRPQSIPSHP